MGEYTIKGGYPMKTTTGKAKTQNVKKQKEEKMKIISNLWILILIKKCILKENKYNQK